VWIIHQADPLQHPAAEKFRAWFRADAGVERIYPWLLFGPYVALLASFFPLERGRLRLSFPINLVACAGFLAASHALNVHTRVTAANVTIIKYDPDRPGESTNSFQLLGTDAANLPQGPLVLGKVLTPPANAAWTDALPAAPPDVSDTNLTTVYTQSPKGFGRLPPLPGVPNLGLWSTLLDLLAYGAVVGLAHSVHFYRRFRERERRALFLESNLAHARLSALRAQLQPHFLFNSLNAIAALLRRDPRLAETTLLSLSELLRLALSQSERQEVPLAEELELVQRYLDIQQTRFGDKLRVEREIEDATLACQVPTLLLQPLVENALRHGIEPADNASLVRLTAHQRYGRLELTVEDDGVGLPDKTVGPPSHQTSSPQTSAGSTPLMPEATLPAQPPAGAGTGIGLANLRTRLEMLYGDGQALELLPRAGGGLIVRIVLPWRSSATGEKLQQSTRS
jgi:signal transduction histidine kinase